MSRSLRAIFNEGSQGKIGAALQQARLGEGLNVLPRTVRLAVSTNVMTLPETARCARILRGYKTVATTPGEVTPLLSNASPSSAGDAAPNAIGNILFLAGDAVTQAEIVYVPYEGEVVEDIIAVSSNLGTLLGGRAAQLLLEAEALAGTVTGAKTIDARNTTTPATTHATLLANGTQVRFNASTDGVTQARVRYIALPGVGDKAGPFGADLNAETRDY